MASLTAKIINNLQVTVKNIHVRYEDKLSVPGHPFAAGVTLAGFTAVSVNDKWEPSFIESMAGAIHKLAKLQSLALYFDTDSESMEGLPPAEYVKKFAALVSLKCSYIRNYLQLPDCKGRRYKRSSIHSETRIR